MRKKLRVVFVFLLIAVCATSSAFAIGITDITQCETTENMDQIGIVTENNQEYMTGDTETANLENIPEPVAEKDTVDAEVEENPKIENDANQEESIVENPPAEEEVIVETPTAETPVVEEPAIETPVVEEPIVEEPIVETPVVEEPIVEEPIVETPVVEEPAIETPVVEEPVDPEAPPVTEEIPVEEIPVVEELPLEEIIVEEPVIAKFTILYHGKCEDKENTIKRVVEGYYVGDTVDLTEYIEDMLTTDYIVYVGEIKEVVLNDGENVVTLDYTYNF